MVNVPVSSAVNRGCTQRNHISSWDTSLILTQIWDMCVKFRGDKSLLFRVLKPSPYKDKVTERKK